MSIDSTEHKTILLDSLLEPFGECLTKDLTWLVLILKMER